MAKGGQGKGKGHKPPVPAPPPQPPSQGKGMANQISGNIVTTNSVVYLQPLQSVESIPVNPAVAPQTTVSDANGNYSFTGLPAGTYNVYTLKGGPNVIQQVILDGTHDALNVNFSQ